MVAGVTTKQIGKWVRSGLQAHARVIHSLAGGGAAGLIDIEAVGEASDDRENWTPGVAQLPQSLTIELANGQSFRVTVEEVV